MAAESSNRPPFRQKTRGRCGGLAVTVLLLACAGEAEQDALRPLPSDAHFELVSAPLMQVGGALPGDAHRLSTVVGAVLVGDSLLVLADGMSKDLRVFGPGGRPLSRLGGSGSGPAEFRILSGMAREGERLYVWDLGNRRLTSRTPDGSRLEGTRVAGAAMMPELIGVLADGSFILRAVNYEQSVLTKMGRSREADVFLHFGSDGIVRATYERPGVDMLIEESGGRKTGSSLVLTRRTLAAAGGDRIYFVETGSGDLEVLDGEGEPVLRGGVGGEPRLVTDDERQALARRHLPPSPMPLPGAQRQSHSAVRDTFPMVDRVLLDADRRLWVRWPVGPFDSLQTWVVLDAALRPQASLTLRADHSLLDVAGDRAAVLGKDAFDVPSVAVRRLTYAGPLH